MAGDVEQFGPYKRVRRLGVGGMAETFLAVQRGAAGFEQRVCMKFILPGYRENADFRRLFLREASIAASLRHSNIVGVIDVDEAAGYLVLELVDGVDLRALLNAAPNHKLAPEIASLITIELCKALSFAHSRSRRGQLDGIVHRDLSPSNVLISYAGEVKLTDFGVARAMRADAEPLSTTVKGKLCYMSPEQARGQLLDGRSDLFSLGVVFYELLSGQRPFDGSSDAETLLRITAGQHTPLLEVAPEIPSGLATIVERLLARDREQRFASADACIDAFARFAPRVTCFRELGQLARGARPHETLIGAELEGFDAEPVAPTVRRGSLTETVALPGTTLPPRTSPPGSQPPPVVEVRSETGVQRVHRNAWYALAASVVMLLVVGSAWVARLTQTQAEPEKNLVVVTPPVDRQPPIQEPPGGPPVEPPPLQQAPQQQPLSLQQPPQQPLRQQPLQPVEIPNGLSSGERSATIDVGVLPFGVVWIDNKKYDWSPVRGIRLKPGRHIIAGGTEKPQVRQAVNLRPGEVRKVAINLETGASPDE